MDDDSGPSLQHLGCFAGMISNVSYWAVQAGLLTPLTFARRRLSPLAAFTSGAWLLLLPVRTFFTMEGGDSE